MANKVTGPSRKGGRPKGSPPVGGRPKGCAPVGGNPKGYMFPGSLSKRCYDAVVKRGEVTISQVLGVVGRFISPSQALRQGKIYLRSHSKPAPSRKRRAVNPDSEIYTISRITEIGRRQVVNNALRHLTKKGSLRRTAPGVYAAPLPKLFEPEKDSGKAS